MMILRMETSVILRKGRCSVKNDRFIYFAVISYLYLIVGMLLANSGYNHSYYLIAMASVVPVSLYFDKESGKK